MLQKWTSQGTSHAHHEADAGSTAAPDRRGTLERLASSERRGDVLSMEATLEFACSMMDEALELASVVVIHRKAPRPLVWRAPSTSEPSLHRACAGAEAAFAQWTAEEPEDPSSLSAHEPRGAAAPKAVTLPLGLPLAGILRVEATAPLGPGKLAFVHHAALLVSLALDRCAEAENTEVRFSSGLAS